MTDSTKPAAGRMTAKERADRVLVAALDACAAGRQTASPALCGEASKRLQGMLAEERKAGIAAALEEAANALMECAVWCDSQEYVDDGWRNGVADARKHIARHIRARADHGEKA